MKTFKYALFSIIILFALSLVYFVTYTGIEPKAYDFMTKNVLISNYIGPETNPWFYDKHKNIYGHDDIVLVVIDDKSTSRFRWPWKRELYCKILNYFNEYSDAKVIVLDFIMSALDKDNPKSDKKYFETINKIDNIIAGTFFTVTENSNQSIDDLYDTVFLNKYAYSNIHNSKLIPTSLYNSILKSPMQYIDTLKYTGSVMSIPGAISGDLRHSLDEIHRTEQLFTKYKNKIIPSLAMRTFLFINNDPAINITKSYIEIPEINYRIKHKITEFQSIVPTRYYKFKTNTEEYSHKKYSAIDIMDSYDAIKAGKKPIINPDIFRNKIIVVGANVPAGSGLNDNSKTPLKSNHPGVDIQATKIDNLVHNDFLTVIPQSVNILITLLGMFLTYMIIKSENIIKGICGSISLIFIYFIISSICFYYAVVINVITPIVMFIVMMIIAFAYKFLIENRNKEKVQNAMGRYMSEDVMKLVIKNIDNLGLGGKKAVVTVLFSDIRGFTSLSEMMSAQQVSELLNEYFTEMEKIITKNNGIINKFIGDAIMAVFGEPIQDENHAINAVLCGYEMLQKVSELHSKWQKENKPLIDIGVGVNTGEVFIGNIGSVNRMEYTVIGDTVNLASRLESYNKTYHTKMLISETTYEASKEQIQVNKISDVEIRGKSQRLTIYEVKGLK